MKRLFVLPLLILLLCVPALATEWIPLMPDQLEGASPTIRTLSSTAVETRVEISIPGFYMTETPEGMHLEVPGWAWTQNVGLPALPKASFLVALPEGYPVALEVDSRDVKTFEGLTIRLFQEPTKDDKKNPHPTQPKAWQGDYPVLDAKPGHAGFMGKLPVTAVLAYPFHLNAETGELSVSSHLQVTVNHDFGYAEWPKIDLTDNVLRRSRSAVVNIDSVKLAPSTRTRGVEYLFLIPAGLQSVIEPLVEWRKKTGFKTEVATFGFTPNQTAVKSRILEYPDLEYALIIGDHEDIPLASWGGMPGDHWYACTSGGGNPDLYADLSIGRLCGNDAARLTPQIEKILDYEKSPPLSGWLKHTALVAHKEQYPGKYTQCCNEIADRLDLTSDWAVSKLYGGETGVSNGSVKWAVLQGVNLLNYRGHGSTTAWTGWNLLGEYFENSDVTALLNGDMRPIVLNIACCCGDIRSYCLNECWLDTPGGAVASLGAVEPSYTIPNHDFDKKLYEAFFELDMTDIGSALGHASTFIVQNHGSLGEDNAKMYLWNGDAALRMWLNIPTDADVTHAASIGTGNQTFEVSVETTSGDAVENARVCILKDEEVHAVGLTGPDGIAAIDISPTTESEMFVTVIHPDHLPYEGSVMVGAGDLHIDTTEFSALNGGEVNFTLNAGVANATRNYILLGTISGTAPGTALPGGHATLPLNFDLFTDIIFSLLNTPVFADFMGQLDGSGQATAQLSAGGVSSTFVGTVMNFAYALNGPWNYASTPVGVTIVEE